MQNKLLILVVLGQLILFSWISSAGAQDDDPTSLEGQHANDKIELDKIKNELKDVKSSMMQDMQKAARVETLLSQQQIKEFNLVVQFGPWELFPGTTVKALAYSGSVPGPVLRVKEGDPVRLIVRNDLKVPTSMHFHGMLLPFGVDGLPRQNAGLIGPGEAYAYEFIAKEPGTFFYHPQIIHLDQEVRGLYGAIVVEPAHQMRKLDHDEVMIFGEFVVPEHLSKEASSHKLEAVSHEHSSSQVANKPESESKSVPPFSVTYFTINGKCAPVVQPLEVRKGERVRLRLISAAQHVIPLHITGHRFEVVAVNGGSVNEPHLIRDTITLNPADRVDVEFTADNPGVWSIGSMLPEQSTNNGKFPGGIARVLRYTDFKP